MSQTKIINKNPLQIKNGLPPELRNQEVIYD